MAENREAPDETGRPAPEGPAPGPQQRGAGAFRESQDTLLGVPEVAAYLGVEPVTVYRWCRDGRLPGLKLGKAWRVRRAALEEFLRQAEQPATLAGHLRAFYSVPDHVLAVAATEALLYRLEAAFLQVGEARGGGLVKFYGPESPPPAALRGRLSEHGLDVAGLEGAGRLRFVAEGTPARGRVPALSRLRDEAGAAGHSVWVSFDWVRQVDVAAAVRQQAEAASLTAGSRLVVQTAVLERLLDDWPLLTERRLRGLHRGVIWLTPEGLSLSRAAPVPPT
jgi:excisionase family DNA binding protein